MSRGEAHPPNQQQVHSNSILILFNAHSLHVPSGPRKLKQNKSTQVRLASRTRSKRPKFVEGLAVHVESQTHVGEEPACGHDDHGPGSCSKRVNVGLV